MNDVQSSTVREGYGGKRRRTGGLCGTRGGCTGGHFTLGEVLI